jgi:SAM-dependent methyltransferase
VADVGCGNAELCAFLRSSDFEGRYVGFDINESLAGQARRRFPDVDIRVVDIAAVAPEDVFDYVCISGLFNLNVGQDLNWMFGLLSAAFRMTTSALVFNAISNRVTFVEDEMFYVPPEVVLAFCIDHLSPRVSLHHHELPFNFTVCVEARDS